MMDEAFWSMIEAEAREAWRGEGRYPLRAYSELMPAQFVGWKPCASGHGREVATLGVTEIDEYEWVHELAPGFDRIAEHILAELGTLMRGDRHALSHTLLDNNPDPSEEEIRFGLAGNLCRCTGYDKIVRAVQDAAREMRGA